MSKREYRVTQGQLDNVFQYMEDIVSRGGCEKVINSRGLLVYNVPIDNEEVLSPPENTAIVLDFISKKIITSGSHGASKRTRAELEGLLGTTLKAEKKQD